MCLLGQEVPTINQPYVFLTTRTSFGAKVQEIAPESACRPARLELGLLGKQDGGAGGGES